MKEEVIFRDEQGIIEDSYYDVHKAIEQRTIKLLAMTKEERIEWFRKSRYPYSLNFDMEIGNTVYAVTTHFNETANESLQEKTQRIILNKM